MLSALAVLIAGIAYCPGILGAATAPRWAAMALGLAALAWRIEFQWRPAQTLLLAGLGYGALSLFWAADPMAGFDDLVHLALFALAVVSGMALPDTRGIRAAAAIACAFMLPWVLVQAWHDQAATGLFSNRDQLAQFAALAALGVMPGKRRFLGWAPVVCLSLSLSIGGVAALLVGWLARVWPEIPPSFRRALVGLLAIAAIVELVAEPSIWANSIATRLEIWRAASAGLSVAGSGIGGLAAAFPGYGYAHNDLLQLAYELGVGALPFLALAILAWRGACGSPHGGAERAVLAGFLAEGLIGFPLFSPATALLGGLVAGRLIGARAPLRVADDAGRNSDRQFVRRGAPAAV